jgi:Fic family protein
MREAPPQLWLLLGEAKSKCTHLAGVPLSDRVARELHEIFLARGVHATTAIEGNTLSEAKVLEIVRKGDEQYPIESYEEREIVNILSTTNKILDYVERHGIKIITVDDIKSYNKVILDGLPVEDHVVPGEFSKVQVGVPGYRGVPPEKREMLMEMFCDWLNGPDFRAKDDDHIVYGLVKAVIAHLYLVWIHPFGDGNGRTARLLEVRILLEAGAPSAAGHLLSDHYNQTRPRYYRELALASQTGGDVMPFIQYAVEGFVSLLREQLLLVKNQQWAVSWINYIHDIFDGKKSKTDKRRRDLILALTEADKGVSREKIRHLNATIAEKYANLTDKTVYRDLEALKSMNLLKKKSDKYVANREMILRYLPRARKGDVVVQFEEANLLNKERDKDEADIDYEPGLFDI